MFFGFIPALGKRPDKDMQLSYRKRSSNYENGKFYFSKDLQPISGSAKVYLSMIRDQLFSKPRQTPKGELPINVIHEFGAVKDNEIAVTWFGHSTLILQISGKTILLDPMLGLVASPVSFAGVKRFRGAMPMNIEELPYIDMVLISHDHYDHLDYNTIKNIDKKVGAYYVPLGVESHLKSWGVAEEKIITMSWWEKLTTEGITIGCTPSKHFSGRSLNDRNSTLWCSWVIYNEHAKLFYSGDTGYGKHFKEISDKYGTFDLAILECGQFDERWKDIHMLPEQVVQASVDLQADTVLPVHWGAFKLAFHEWDYPIKTFLKLAEPYAFKTITPMIGETVNLDRRYDYCRRWWKDTDITE